MDRTRTTLLWTPPHRSYPPLERTITLELPALRPMPIERVRTRPVSVWRQRIMLLTAIALWTAVGALGSAMLLM